MNDTSRAQHILRETPIKSFDRLSRNSFFHLCIQYVVNVMESKINVESYGKRPVIRSLEAAKRIPGRWLNDDYRPRLRCASSRLHVYHCKPEPLFLNSAFQPTGE